MTLDFSLRRFGLITRNNLEQGMKNVLLAAGVMAGAYILLYILALRIGYPAGLANNLSLVTLATSGVIIASGLFSQIQKPGEATAFYMVPASLLEKYLSRCVLATIGLILGELILFSLADLVARGLAGILGLPGALAFNPLDSQVLSAVGSILVAQSIFIFGSLVFKKSPFLKTLLSLLGIMAANWGAVSLAAYFVLTYGNPSFIGNSSRPYMGEHGEEILFSTITGEYAWIGTIINVFCYGVVPVGLLVLGYWRLHKKEVR